MEGRYFFSDMSVMLGRSMRHIIRSMDTILTVAITPIAMMLLFIYVFGGAIQSGADNYVNYLLPGILLIAISSGIAYTAYRLFQDVQRGIFERFHSMPIAHSAVLWGHVLTSLVSNAISLIVIVLVAVLMGFRSSCGILSWLAVIAGLSAKTIDGASAFSYPLIFLPFISSAFVPTVTMPTIVRVFAENQPVTSIVNAIRALLSNRPVGNDIWIAIAWCVGIMAVAYVVAIRAYKRRILSR